MEQFFTSLSKRQTMLLLTSLAFGGQQGVEAFSHLTEEEEELLTHRAKALLQIPRDKRIPLLVQEIKRLVTQRRRQLASAEPRRLIEVLLKERGATVEIVLRALPVELAESVRLALPAHRADFLTREVKPEILSIIRWKLEQALKKGAPQVGSFRFTDLVLLQQRELLALVDRMGVRVLATAIAGLSEEARSAWLARLPPDQRTLAVRAAEAGVARKLEARDADVLLSTYGALEDPPQGIRSAGAQRIARACLAQSAEFAQRMVERHPDAFGQLLERWVEEEQGRAVRGDGGRLDILEQLERLARKGVVDRPMRLPPPLRPPPTRPREPSPEAVVSKAAAAASPPVRRSTETQDQEPTIPPRDAPQRPVAPRGPAPLQPLPQRKAAATQSIASVRANNGPKRGPKDGTS